MPKDEFGGGRRRRRRWASLLRGSSRRWQVDVLLVEARGCLGGRAWTINTGRVSRSISAAAGSIRPIATLAGHRRGRKATSIDRTPPPWSRPALPRGAPSPDQAAFGEAMGSFRGRLPSRRAKPIAPSSCLEPGGRWNGLVDAVSTFYSGAELDCISARDLARYDDTGVNWRIVAVTGPWCSRTAPDCPVRLSCPVQRIDRRGKRLRVETAWARSLPIPSS